MSEFLIKLSLILSLLNLSGIMVFFILLSCSTSHGMDDIRELDLHKPVYYHKEVILMSPAKQFGGLYIQIEDAPFSLKRIPFYAPKMKTRRIKNLIDNLTENALPPTSVFGFLQEVSSKR